MNGVIGDILPMAMGVAITPVSVLATLLLLLSQEGRRRSLPFALGWLLGIAIIMTVFVVATLVLKDVLTGDPKPVLGSIQLVLGSLLLIRAVRLWAIRRSQDADWPKWMSTIDEAGAGAAALRGLHQVTANTKNLLLTASAAAVIVDATLGVGPSATVIGVFTAIAGVSVLVPLVAGLAASDRARPALAAARVWIVRQYAGVMTVVLLLMGSVVLGKGIGHF
ncbi:GAP family protein [Microbacterium sp. NIBRBAC000506063]|uniref:GAP family protein n=1 Tax=Microbacterium sp. NIBRBAC000506063 TaxID=2734618 RepID=UPI001BB5FBAF|nr:GAP family protein [Microbacterium sp. NIBRBAC000506063]QTV80509.1 GAP family protein [Microbacterium sp. NIBRBAC000506063]